MEQKGLGRAVEVLRSPMESIQRTGVFCYKRKEDAMKKRVLIATMVSILWVGPAVVFSEPLALRPQGEGQWELYSKTGNAVVGTVKKTEEGNYKFYGGEGEYIGLILESRTWIPRDARRSYTRIEPEEAELYLDVLKAIETLKKP
jgi:hypothetical protein